MNLYVDDFYFMIKRIIISDSDFYSSSSFLARNTKLSTEG